MFEPGKLYFVIDYTGKIREGTLVFTINGHSAFKMPDTEELLEYYDSAYETYEGAVKARKKQLHEAIDDYNRRIGNLMKERGNVEKALNEWK